MPAILPCGRRGGNSGSMPMHRLTIGQDLPIDAAASNQIMPLHRS
ncbi:hypothetical protein [Novosphingobium sp. Fuku2-ISO-50]|nr:hypothetical protein [Novosphingobium sp. Fuku2-ISO-50]